MNKFFKTKTSEVSKRLVLDFRQPFANAFMPQKWHVDFRSLALWLFAGVMLWLVVGMALAGNSPSQPRNLMASGGSQASNGALSLSSALGQPVAGSVGAGDLIGASGFWVGTGIQPQPTPIPGGDHFIYLPTVIR